MSGPTTEESRHGAFLEMLDKIENGGVRLAAIDGYLEGMRYARIIGLLESIDRRLADR